MQRYVRKCEDQTLHRDETLRLKPRSPDRVCMKTWSDKDRPFLLNRYDNPRVVLWTVNTRDRGRPEVLEWKINSPRAVSAFELIYRPTRNTDLSIGGEKNSSYSPVQVEPI